MAPVLKPELGDLIEIDRGSYQHWAVYVGDGFVVHLTVTSGGRGGKSSSSGSVLTDQAVVKKEKLWDVVGKDKWKIKNSLDDQHKPRPSDIIVKAAGQLVGQQLPYDLLTKNCEHFVNDLRYGKAESRQVLKVAAGLATGVAVGAYAGVTAGVVAGVAVVASPVVLGAGIVVLARALFGGSKKGNAIKYSS